MPYSAALAARVRYALSRTRGVGEKRMFGGIGFLLNGNLLVGVMHDTLIARLGPDGGAAALGEPHVRPFDFTGKPIRNWIVVEPDGVDTERQLTTWIDRATAFVQTLPAK